MPVAEWWYVIKFCFQKLVAMATFLDRWKRGLDLQSTTECLLFGEKIVKVGPLDPEIIGLREIIKTLSKYIARSASSPSGLNNWSYLQQLVVVGLCHSSKSILAAVSVKYRSGVCPFVCLSVSLFCGMHSTWLTGPALLRLVSFF